MYLYQRFYHDLNLIQVVKHLEIMMAFTEHYKIYTYKAKIV